MDEKKTPIFCICTPTIRGRTRLLRAAMESVKAQTFKDYIHVVCTDGEAPGAGELCAELGATFDSIPQMGNWGYGVRNHVVQKYDAKYFLFLDDDNIYKPECLQTLVEFMAERMIPQGAYVGPPFISFQIDWIARWLNPPCRWVIPWGPKVEKGNFDQMCLCIRSDIAKKVKFQPIYEQDFQFATECLAASGGEVAFVPKVLGVYSWSWEQDGGKRED